MEVETPYREPAFHTACQNTGGKIAQTLMPAKPMLVDLPVTTHKASETKISIPEKDQNVALRLASHIGIWREIETDAFICSAVFHGYKLINLACKLITTLLITTFNCHSRRYIAK